MKRRGKKTMNIRAVMCRTKKMHADMMREKKPSDDRRIVRGLQSALIHE